VRRVPRAPVALTAAEARRAALWAQGLVGAPDRGDGAAGVLARLGAVQLDTISVLARSHELVPYARIGPVPRERVEQAYWGSPARAFEYWAHAACLLPIDDWPLFAMRRARHERMLEPDGGTRAAVLRRLEAEGPRTARDLGGARQGGPWWDWSPLKRAAEELLAAGRVVCVDRRGWQRVYDLAERAVPADLLAQRPSDEECKVALAARACAALGVATLDDIADYHRQRPGRLGGVLHEAGLVPVAVEGWGAPAWATPEALSAAERSPGRVRTTLLSPFDSLVWHRPRTERIFGFRHRLEAYVPAPKRTHGYFAMPVLAGGRLVGRVDPARDGGAFVARQVSIDRPAAIPGVARAIAEAARWVRCERVRLERVEPPEHATRLRASLDAATRAM
jgi:uncharacterized protein YcaQ